MDTIILIPAYMPDETLVGLARELREKQFHILIVNDGSGEAYAPIFERVSEYAEVIGYEKNCGKGYALKYGMQHIRNEHEDFRYFVTADADGQHAIKDILRVSEKIHETGGIVLGSRAFTGKIPLKSRMGNDLSRFTYAIASSLYLQDNQTGLRGFEVSYCDWLCSIGGDHYDYEINMLMHAGKRNIPIHEIPIRTIYSNGNKGSHFRPVADTLRLQAKILIASIPSLAAFVCMLAAIFFLRHYLPLWTDVFSPNAVRDVAVVDGGVFGILVSFLLNTCTYAMRAGVPFRLSWRKLLVSVIRVGAYQLLLRLLCGLLHFPFVPSLVLTILLVLVVEFLLLKLIFLLQNRNNTDPRTRNL
ncbi:MAG: glycosyltransferase family 2 protein [Clostridia bacterium]|nr:glycosyltransferase family 2 protein [Clostridia bacterium]